MKKRKKTVLERIDELDRPGLDLIRKHLDSLSKVELLREALNDPVVRPLLTEEDIQKMRDELARLEAEENKPR
jgi:hypothetical protein